MWTRVNIVDTPGSLRLEFGPGTGRHLLAFVVMVAAALSVYALLNQGEVGPASLILSGVVILLGALLRMALRARYSVALTDSGLHVERRGVPPQTFALNHVESFVVESDERRSGVPGHHLCVYARNSESPVCDMGRGLGQQSLQDLADQLTARLQRLRG